MKKNTLLVVLGGGGHTKQLLKLVKHLGRKYDYEYIISASDVFSEKKIEFRGKIFRILNPRGMDDKSIIKVILKFIPSTLQLLAALFQSKAGYILAAGPALSLHVAFLGKFIFGRKVIFLESWSRVYTKSFAGRLTYPFADLFFIQWPKEKKNYPRAVYEGRLG